MAAVWSPMLLGYEVEAVWHSSVVLDGQDEIFFGAGIHRARAGCTPFGRPARVIDLGTSEVSPAMLEELLADLAPRYTAAHYNLLWHNCNTFADELGQLLTGEGLPDYILAQAQHVFNSPLGERLMPFMLALEGFTGQATAGGFAGGPHPAGGGGSAPGQPGGAAAAAAAAAAGAAAASASASAGSSGGEAVAGAAPGSAREAHPPPPPPSSPATASAASAGAQAAMAAIARAAQQQQQQQPPQQQQVQQAPQQQQHQAQAQPRPGATTPVDKAAAGVAALQLNADSRAAAE